MTDKQSRQFNSMTHTISTQKGKRRHHMRLWKQAVNAQPRRKDYAGKYILTKVRLPRNDIMEHDHALVYIHDRIYSILYTCKHTLVKLHEKHLNKSNLLGCHTLRRKI